MARLLCRQSTGRCQSCAQMNCRRNRLLCPQHLLALPLLRVFIFQASSMPKLLHAEVHRTKEGSGSDLTPLWNMRDENWARCRMIGSVYALYSSRVIPNFMIFDCRVVRFMPSLSAAPRAPAMTPPDSRRVRKMYSRSTSSKVEPNLLVRSGEATRSSAMGT